ncbi:MAG: hypothetical protein EA397_01440 [Deltaproteobacteria bacterium]|nr:MAG: hypothetical protein EA397_01440 [Deltaproteobacteria bacterium]
MRLSRRNVLLGLALVIASAGVLGGLSLLHPRVRYVVTAAAYQLELLWGRVDLEHALATGDFTPAQRARLEQVPRIRDFAVRQGLAETGHYSTISPGWNHTVYNVSACEPLRFRPRTWWFPIVGRVPYLGYFDQDQAQHKADALRAEGLDVYVRTAGAWSTLGWFNDPLLPAMADWTEARLANVLLHELTHATVWIPGSVAFNESLANFVGDTASLAYLRETYGSDSPEVTQELKLRADRDRFGQMMRELYKDLDDLYREDLPDPMKEKRKKAILDTIPDRTRAAGFHNQERWVKWVQRDPWNNARLVQFRVYNRSPEWFEAVLHQEDEDLPRFFQRIEAIARGAADPYRALAEAAGVDPDEREGSSEP